MRVSGPNWGHWPSWVSTPPQGPKGGARLTQLCFRREPGEGGPVLPPEACCGWGRKADCSLIKGPQRGGPQDHPLALEVRVLVSGGICSDSTFQMGLLLRQSFPPPCQAPVLSTSLTSGFHCRDYWGEPSSGPGCRQEAEGLGPCPPLPRGPRSTPQPQLNRGHGDARPVWRD